MRARRVWIGMMGLALACGGGPDVDALETVAQAVRDVPAADQGQILLAGLSETDVGVVSDVCATKLYAGLVTTDPALRATMIAEAFSGSCPESCGQEAFAAMAAMDPQRRTEFVVGICDAAGPDPVFGAPALSEIRKELDTTDYLVARTLLEPALSATEGTEVGRRYGDLLEGVAVSLAARGARRTYASADRPTDIQATSNVDLAAATAVVEAASPACGWGTARVVLAADGTVRLASGDASGSGPCVADALSSARFPASTDGGLAVVDVAWGGRAIGEADVLSILGVMGEEGVEGLGALPGGGGGTGGDPFGGDTPFVPRDGNAPPRGPTPTLTTSPPEIVGSLSKDAITRVVKRHSNQIRYCYDTLLRDMPGASGRLEVKFVIAVDGTVSSADAKSSTVPPELEGCVLGRVKQWAFPAPDGGGIVVVTYPFTFTPS